MTGWDVLMNGDAINTARIDLLTIYHTALDAVRGDRVVEGYLRQHPITGPLYVVAIGKAAQSMAQGAMVVLGQQVRAGLIISKYEHTSPLPGMHTIEAAHPVPDDNSLMAGAALLEFIDQAEAGVPFLFLISGGASALVDVLVEGVTLDDLQQINRRLLQQGKTITEMNAVRKQLSLIKGGKLAAYLQGRKVTNLLISDVPDDDPRTIGSGLLLSPDPLEGQLAEKVLHSLGLNHLITSTSSHATDFNQIDTHIIATNTHALRAAADKSRKLGYEVVVQEELEGNAYAAAEVCVATLLAGSPGVYLWGGETVVHLPDDPGRGGRNQAFALHAATWITQDNDIVLLSAGTDGTDGVTADAGALVDSHTVQRAEAEGCIVAECLARADSGTCLEASGDLIQTGVTGTNVMDVVIGLKLAEK